MMRGSIHPNKSLMTKRLANYMMKKVIAVWLPIIFFTGCGSAPIEIESVPTQKNLVEKSLDSKDIEEINLLMVDRNYELAKAESIIIAKHHRNQLLIDNHNSSTLLAIDSRLAWLQGDTAFAEKLLEQLFLQNKKALPFVLREREARAAIRDDWVRAAETRFELSKIAESGKQQSKASDAMFGYLLRSKEAELLKELEKPINNEWRAWITMQLAFRAGRASFQQWQRESSHLLISPLEPRHLQAWLNTPTPSKITMIGQFDGELRWPTEAVLNGAITALYKLYPDPNNRPLFTALDGSKLKIENAYFEATESGAEVVIGPLSKQRVSELISLKNLPVPVIALNRPVDLASNQEEFNNITALSLAPEDEAKQIAQVAFGQGCRNAVVLYNESRRGSRLHKAFELSWSRIGGKVRASIAMTGKTDDSQELGLVLGSVPSDRRISSVKKSFNLPVDSRGRRRQDFECIFMLAPEPALAKSWRPLLIFHHCADIPVYATSAIHSDREKDSNRDLSGVQFVEIPAILAARRSQPLSGLKALGQDAIMVAHNWQQLRMTQSSALRGQTGILTWNADGYIERSLDLAVFDKRSIKPASLR